MQFDLSRRLAAEGLGTMILVATVVGSGIMADRLTDDAALMLLVNSIATGATLVVLITIFGGISGAHFNPAISVCFALTRSINVPEAALRVTAQIGGGVIGTLLAHAMFDLPLWQMSQTVRSGPPQFLSETVAACGLVLTILLGQRMRPDGIGWLVGLYIVAAYWFSASTSFANPAVAIARSLSDTFSGIRPIDLPGFILAEFAGALIGLMLAGWLLSPSKPAKDVAP